MFFHFFEFLIDFVSYCVLYTIDIYIAKIELICFEGNVQAWTFCLNFQWGKVIMKLWWKFLAAAF